MQQALTRGYRDILVYSQPAMLSKLAKAERPHRTSPGLAVPVGNAGDSHVQHNVSGVPRRLHCKHDVDPFGRIGTARPRDKQKERLCLYSVVANKKYGNTFSEERKKNDFVT